MNYQHSYHAGAVADVFKHSVVLQLIEFLQKKPAPMCYIETHAGEAIYDLQANPSQKTLEYKDGIAKLWKAKADLPKPLADYLQLVRSFNPDDTLQFYPGSGLFAKQYLREHDEAILCELHPSVYEKLQYYFRHDKQIHAHYRNGYEALTALLPPKEKRGMVLIDPPFEATDEFEQVLKALTLMQTRWNTGTYVIWFPIKEYQQILNFYHSLKKLEFKNIMAAECWSKPNAEQNRLKGSGLVIINAPWQFDKVIEPLLPEILKALGLEEKGKSKFLWLAKDK